MGNLSKIQKTLIAAGLWIAAGFFFICIILTINKVLLSINFK